MILNPPFRDPEPDRGPKEDVLTWLQSWSAQQLPSAGRRGPAVQIEATNSEEWRIEIDLSESNLQYANAGGPNDFQILKGEDEDEWIRFRIHEGCFSATCGAKNLKETLELFRAFATSLS